jgi:hypothetical protein
VKICLLIIILLTVFVESALATPQIPDILIYNNDTLSIFANPLEQLEDVNSLRKKMFSDNKEHWNTACWRGYQAEWTVIDNELYLTAIYSCRYYEDSIKSDLKQLFGEKLINGKIKANWITAKILSPQGKKLYSAHSGYESLYEKEVVFEFVNGQLKGSTTYDNSKSRISIYSQDTALQRFIYTNIQWEKLPIQDKPVKVFVQFSGNEQGVIDSVKVMKGFDVTFDNEALRVVKSIPKWDVYYRLGQYERRVWNLPIVFSEKNRQQYKQITSDR